MHRPAPSSHPRAPLLHTYARRTRSRSPRPSSSLSSTPSFAPSLPTPNAQPPVICLLANKVDLLETDADGADAIAKGRNFADANGALFFKTSAPTNEGGCAGGRGQGNVRPLTSPPYAHFSRIPSSPLTPRHRRRLSGRGAAASRQGQQQCVGRPFSFPHLLSVLWHLASPPLSSCLSPPPGKKAGRAAELQNVVDVGREGDAPAQRSCCR